jgi:hypothetical protein
LELEGIGLGIDHSSILNKRKCSSQLELRHSIPLSTCSKELHL